MSRVTSLVVLIGIVLIIGFFAFRVLSTFLVPLFLAVLLVLIFQPLHKRVVEWCRGRQRLAALATTAIVLLLVLVPAGLVLTLAAAEGVSLAKRFDPDVTQQRLTQLRGRLGLQIPAARELRGIENALTGLLKLSQDRASQEEQQAEIEALRQRVDELEARLREARALPEGLSLEPLRNNLSELAATRAGTLDNQNAAAAAFRAFSTFRTDLLGGPVAESLKLAANPGSEQLAAFHLQVADWVQEWLAPAAGATGVYLAQTLLGLVIMIVSVYFFFVDGPMIIAALTRLSPLDDRYERELLDEFDRVSRAVVLATLLSAVVQGVLAGIGFWVAGVNAVFLLTLLTMLCALVPFVGAAAVWISVCLWLVFFEDRWLAAILLAVYGTAIISTADNVVKPMVLHGRSNLHPLLALLSILGGVQALGPIGILIGPMIVAFLQTLLNILSRELTAMAERSSTPPDVPQAAG
jgi:predicted PurR-regulated permease PerM